MLFFCKNGVRSFFLHARLSSVIILATDHAGYRHKEALKKYLLGKEYDVLDLGTDSEEACDYPDFMIRAARKVAEDPEHNRAIIFGGSGQGEAMAANRIKSVRATVFYGGSDEILKLSRTHNDANILSIGARFVSEEETIRAVDMWLGIEFPAEERHVRRILKIDMLV